MNERQERMKEKLDVIEQAWWDNRVVKGKEIGKVPCPNPSHRYVEARPELIYSSPHLHWDFGDCDGWLDDA